MATTRSFQTLLNEYLPNRLLKEELLKRDYILSTVQKDDSWKGGKIIVPFKSAGATSVSMGSLTASNDIAEDQYVRGEITDYKEAWGSMIFNHRDLMDHSGKIPETTFLKILPDTIEDFMSYMKMVVSVQLGTGPAFASFVGDEDLVNGVFETDRIDRFQLGQKVTIDDDDSVAADYYVIAIDVNAGTVGNNGTVTVSATRGGAAANISAYTTAQNAKCYTDGADTTSFQSIRDALLSNANGGGANLHGVAKTSAPFLQGINYDGSAVTAANIVTKLFDFYNQVRRKARGKASKFLMSYKNLASVIAAIEDKTNFSGNFNISAMDRKASLYGWDEVTITSVKGSLTCVGLQEWDDDIIVAWDPSSMTFRSNGFFTKRKNPEGHEYFEVRNTTGYQYIVDVCLFGELEVTRPQNNAIMYGISY
jgi:hypothetical protein